MRRISRPTLRVSCAATLKRDKGRHEKDPKVAPRSGAAQRRQLQAVVRRGPRSGHEGRRRIIAPTSIYRAVWRGAAAATAAGKTPPPRQAGAPPPTGRAEIAPSTIYGRMVRRRCRESGGKTAPPRQMAPARPTIPRRASVAARRDRPSERTVGTPEQKDGQARYEKCFAATNAPLHLRRRSEARR